MALEILPPVGKQQPSPTTWPGQLGHYLAEQQQQQQQQEDEISRSGKRPRVALACQRCKVRKQKCDGSHPCAKCRTNNHECEYVVPQKPMPFGKNRYIKALEQRVAELETILATQGMAELSSDHWPAATATSTAGTSEAGQGAGSNPASDPGPDDLDEAVLDWREGVDSVVSVLRSLSLDVNGSGYVGASSHIALGRLFNFLGKRKHEDGGPQRRQSRQQSIVTLPTSLSTSADAHEAIDLTDIAPAIADRLFAGYLKHIATRWPVIHSEWVREIHGRRQSLTDIYEITMLHLVYATAGRFIETTGELGDFRVKRHYASAIQALDTILEFNDLRTVRALMLMAVYCLRDQVGAGAWTYSRTALLIAIDHGLHRQTKALSRLSLESELRKRLFWACYAFDRQISIPMGRPFGISDRDIDIDLPLDIDEGTTEDGLSSALATKGPRERRSSTSLSPFIHITRLRQIESDIQQTIYRVDQNISIDDSVIDQFLTRLEQWKAMIPEDTRRFKDATDIPFDGYDYYVRTLNTPILVWCTNKSKTADSRFQMVFFYKCQRLLLYPQISKSTVAPRFLKECAKACAGVCGAYKRLHQSLAVGYSLLSLQTVFMAGKCIASRRLATWRIHAL